MPYAAADLSTGALFYSYTVGSVHVLVLSAYVDLSATGAQAVFLNADLAAVNRSVTPWVIAVWHPPWYNTNSDHQGDGEVRRRRRRRSGG